MGKDIYRSSRICYILEAAFEYFITILIGGVYLANLTGALGFTDRATGIISSFVNLACCVQILSIAIFKDGHVKRTITILHIINQTFFALMYLVPFFKVGHTAQTVLLVIFLLLGYFIHNLVLPAKTSWFISLIDDIKRGIFTSIKEMVSLFSAIIFQRVMSRMIDYYNGIGEEHSVFFLSAITIFVLMLLHTLTLIFSREKPAIEESDTNKISPWNQIRERFSYVFSNKTVIKVILVSIFWNIATHFVLTYFYTYQRNELGFDMNFIFWLSVFTALARVPASLLLAYYADRYSFAKMLNICYWIAAASFLVAMFAVPSNGRIVYTLYQILYSIAMGGINSAETNLLFDFVPQERRTDAYAVKQTVYGLCGFATTLAVSPLFKYLQQRQQHNIPLLFGRVIYAQQALSFLTFLGIILLWVYLNTVILKLKTQTVREPLRKG